MPGIHWDPALIAKYNIHGPRYTSYPTALALQAPFDSQTVRDVLLASAGELSLYLHLPFCHQLCYYCGCNKVITRHQHKADRYLDALEQEMAMYQPLVAHRPIGQIHLGGGTPTFLTEQQLSRLMQLFHQHFDCTALDELSIEIDPRSCSLEKLAHLRGLGFNRVSFGVQDFDQQVQITINRVQDADLVRQLVQVAKKLGFASINLDLVYGLPYQQAASFQQTLDQVVALDPDRVSLFSYAHLPARFAAQRKLPEAAMPGAQTKLALLQQGIATFSQAGYQFIGMDHFAKPDDSLALAQAAGQLHRNFQGYTTHADCDLVAMGVSAISQIGRVYYQNEHDLAAYTQAVNQQKHAIRRGVCLSDDDIIRGAVINQLICHFELDPSLIEKRFGIVFADYFAAEQSELSQFEADGLIQRNHGQIQVTPAGRLLIRRICMAFDAYIPKQQPTRGYSRII